MQEAGDLGQEARFAPRGSVQGKPFPFDVSQGPSLQGHFFRVSYSMAKVLLQFTEDQGTASHDLRIFIKKGAGQVKRLSAVDIKPGLRKRGGNYASVGHHLFVNIYHQPASQTRWPMRRFWTNLKSPHFDGDSTKLELLYHQNIYQEKINV